MNKYRLVSKKGEGTFSEVLKAQRIIDGKYFAIKYMKNKFDSYNDVNNLREIKALHRLSPHENIIELEEVLYDQSSGKLALVFEIMEANLYEVIRDRRHFLNERPIKLLMYQLFKSLDHLHRRGIFHRDIKPENILIRSNGTSSPLLKLADFGSCRGVHSKQPFTEYISTRWYRSPECLLTDGFYGPEMDLWGAGCVFFEITSLYPLFPGTNELDQIHKIHKVLGTPSSVVLAKLKKNGSKYMKFNFPHQSGISLTQLIPQSSKDCIDLMMELLQYDASDRITAREALRHPFFNCITSQRNSVKKTKSRSCSISEMDEAVTDMEITSISGSIISKSSNITSQPIRKGSYLFKSSNVVASPNHVNKPSNTLTDKLTTGPANQSYLKENSITAKRSCEPIVEMTGAEDDQSFVQANKLGRKNSKSSVSIFTKKKNFRANQHQKQLNTLPPIINIKGPKECGSSESNVCCKSLKAIVPLQEINPPNYSIASSYLLEDESTKTSSDSVTHTLLHTEKKKCVPQVSKKLHYRSEKSKDAGRRIIKNKGKLPPNVSWR